MQVTYGVIAHVGEVILDLSSCITKCQEITVGGIDIGNRYSYKQTLEEWCIDNNRQDILDLWDYDKNNVLPSEVPSGTKRKYYFKCHNGIHNSETKRILSITDKSTHRIICKQCEAEGLYREDLTGRIFGDLTVLYRDEEKSKNPYRIDYWVCRCSCGNIVSVDRYKLVYGKKTICGKAGRHKLSSSESKKLSDFRDTPEYRQYRIGVITKDKSRCIITGEKIKNPEVHHIYPFALYPKERLDINCGVCISKEYHSTCNPGSFHSVYGVYNNTPEQFQEYVNMKRRELGIEEFFDVYEYMNPYDADNLEIDDSMLCL